MGRVNVDDLKPGMTLESDLIGPNNRFLLPRGLALEASHLRILKTWGVTEAGVQGVTREEAEALTEAELQAENMETARAALAPHFAATDLEHPAMREVFRLCTLRVAQGRHCDCLLPEPPPAPDPNLGPESDLFAKGAGAVQDLVRNEVQLSSFPDIYFQINEVLQSPRASASLIADVVSKDVSLTATLLKLVNSAFYGFPARIDSIPRAIAVVGTNELTTLAMGVSVVHYFDNIPNRLADMKGFWKHSIACGALARVLSSAKVGLSEERFFVAGLIHDVGRLLMYKRLPFAATQALALHRSTRAPLRDVEQELLGFDHAEAGAALLREWRFPATLETPVRHHHDPRQAMNPLEPAIIHVADVLALALQCGSSGTCYVPALRERAWEVLGLPVSILAQAMAQADRQICEIQLAFLGE